MFENCLKTIGYSMFDIIRVVDPVASEVLYLPNGELPIEHHCYDTWKNHRICTNCVALSAYHSRKTMVKIEYNEERIYWIMAHPIEENGKTYVVEALKDVTDTGIINEVGSKTVLEIKKEIEQMNKLVVTDELTGCFNRRYLEERLIIDLFNCAKGLQDLVLVILDLDYFKRINDMHGHLGGDALLKATAETIQGALTDSLDWMARFGGEEFVIVLHNKSVETCRKIMESLRESIATAAFYYSNRPISLTVSMGIASTQESLVKDKLIDIADRKLYQAKQSGRNQIVC